MADLLAVPELTDASPWLDRSTLTHVYSGISDEAYESLPAQLLPRLRPDPIGRIWQRPGGLTIRFAGLDGGPYAVQASRDLRSWHTLAIRHAREGEFEYVVPSTGPAQFFRAVLLPANTDALPAVQSADTLAPLPRHKPFTR